MGGKTDVIDVPGSFFAADVFDEWAAHDVAEFIEGVDVMDKAQFDMPAEAV